MKIRAKMQVIQVVSTDYGSEMVSLQAVYSGRPEDNTFSKATPAAKLEMTIDNPEAQGFLKAGKHFYVDFTRVIEKAAASCGFAVLLGLAGTLALPLDAQTVPLAWNASPSTNVLTYKLYASTNALTASTLATATTNVACGTNLTCTVTPALAGNWWFAVTAVDTNGLESLPSNIIQVEVPAAPSGLRTVIVQYSYTLTNFVDAVYLKFRFP